MISETVIIAALNNIPALILGGVLLYRERTHRAELGRLLDRIMAADYKEYKRFQAPPVIKEFPSGMSDEELEKATKHV